MDGVEGVPDFETIDVELDEDLKKQQTTRCSDEFLNSLCLDGDEEFMIPPTAEEEEWLNESGDHDEDVDDEEGLEQNENNEEGLGG